MSVVCQIKCVGGFTYSFPIRLSFSFSMDEKEAEARPVMGTIFLVNVCMSVCLICQINFIGGIT